MQSIPKQELSIESVKEEQGELWVQKPGGKNKNALQERRRMYKNNIKCRGVTTELRVQRNNSVWEEEEEEEEKKRKEILRIWGLINRAILEVPAAVFRNMIMLCFSEGGGGREGSGGTLGLSDTISTGRRSAWSRPAHSQAASVRHI